MPIRSRAVPQSHPPDMAAGLIVHSNGTITPVLDPTHQTTMALAREIDNLKELFDVRFVALDKATELYQKVVANAPTISVIEERVASLAKLDADRFESISRQFTVRDDSIVSQFAEKSQSIQAQFDEKFQSIQVQFRERDTRTEQTSRDAKTAVDAALQAAKEAVGEQNKSGALAIAKSETSTIKQIDQIAILLQNVNKATDDKISDLKDRLTMIEGRAGGQGSVVAYLFAALGLLGSLVGAVYAITRR